MTEPEPIYVPVVNANYLPEGIVRLEGYVSPASGGNPDDALIAQQKAELESLGLESGPTDENAWVDPSPEPPVEPEEPPVLFDEPKDDETTTETPTESGF